MLQSDSLADTVLESVSCTSTSSEAAAVDQLTTALSASTLSISASQTGAVNRRDFTVTIPVRPTQPLPGRPASSAQLTVCVRVELCTTTHRVTLTFAEWNL